MTRGTTLLDLLAALAVAALLALLAIPALARTQDRLAVDAAAQALVAAHARARLVAVTERRPVILTLTDDTLSIHAIESPSDTVLRWRDAGPRVHGVITQGLPRQVTYAPSGVTLGFANGTCTLTRGAARRQVVVSRYGRVRVA
jgi:Tfp pilus assembly protein FimT